MNVLRAQYSYLPLIVIIAIFGLAPPAMSQVDGSFIIPNPDDIDAFTISGILDPTTNGSCKLHFSDPDYFGPGMPYSYDDNLIAFDQQTIIVDGDLYRLESGAFFFTDSLAQFGVELLVGTGSTGFYHFTTEESTTPTPPSVNQFCTGYVEVDFTIDESQFSSSIAEVTTHVTSCDYGNDSRYTFDTPCIARWRDNLFNITPDPITPFVDPGVALKLGATTNSITCTLKKKGVALARANIELQRQTGNKGDFTMVAKKKTNAKGVVKFDSTTFSELELTPFDAFRCFSSTKKKRAVSREAVYRPSSTQPGQQ